MAVFPPVVGIGSQALWYLLQVSALATAGGGTALALARNLRSRTDESQWEPAPAFMPEEIAA